MLWGPVIIIPSIINQELEDIHMARRRKDASIFSITIGDLQNIAIKKIGRTLIQEELLIARKSLEYGLLTDIDTIYSTIFYKMIGS